MMRAFSNYRFDRNRLRNCSFPVFYGYADLTTEMEELQAAILGRLLPDIQIRRFHGIHHFVPPERIYNAPTQPGSSRALSSWSDAETSAGVRVEVRLSRFKRSRARTADGRS